MTAVYLQESLSDGLATTWDRGGIFNISSKQSSICRPYKVMRTDRNTTKCCSISPPPFTYWYWVEQSIFTQSFRLITLDPYGDQNSTVYAISGDRGAAVATAILWPVMTFSDNGFTRISPTISTASESYLSCL